MGGLSLMNRLALISMVLSFDSIVYQNHKHESAKWVKQDSSKWHLLEEIHLLYKMDLDDSLWVSILEFENDAFALAYYINSGRFQGALPVVKGPLLEQSIRSGRWLFIFRHKRFYPHDRRLLEEYVQQFPGYRGGLPQEFLSLPFENREPGKTSVQIDLFHGEKISFPMFVQREIFGKNFFHLILNNFIIHVTKICFLNDSFCFLSM